MIKIGRKLFSRKENWLKILEGGREGCWKELGKTRKNKSE
jgi:hypothetical protein